MVDNQTLLQYHSRRSRGVLSHETENRRHVPGPDRRRFPRGGRRAEDKPGRHPTIAIVEQYEGVRRPVARYLDHFHFDVEEAADPNQGLALLGSDRPPAVLLIEDTEAATLLQKEARERAIPFVSLTTALSDTTFSRAESIGAAGLLVKPFSLGAMLQEIRRVLRTPIPA
jgi:CheY-like chemotaxis protein